MKQAKKKIQNETLNWLLDGPDWLKYAVETQILMKTSNPLPAIQDPEIQTIVSKLKNNDEGFKTIFEGKASYLKEVYWYTFFLADIGFSAKDLTIEEEFEEILKLEDNEHKFILSKEMKPDYFCISSILLSSIAKMSSKIKTKLYPHVNTIMDSQRLDGGWHCAIRRSVGKRLQDTDSCPMDNLNILLLLGQYDEFRNDSRLNGAIDLLLHHWERRDEKWRPYGFGVGTNFTRLRYPAFKYGILRVLDALSLYPYAVRSKSFKNMFKYVFLKSPDGRYTPESTAKSFAGFDFGQKKEPSRWITFLIARIEKRINDRIL